MPTSAPAPLSPSSRRRAVRMAPAPLAMALAAAFCAAPAAGQALPAGGVAIHGQAQVTQPAANQLLVTTRNGPGTNHSAIDWQSFSIGAGASAHFAQPNAASTSINRVVTNTPSALFGSLSSNGHLVLVNQAGIAIGAGAMIDTAGFTASTLRMTDADALAGRLRFGDAGTPGSAALTVDGQILARHGDVVLIAPQLETGASALVQAPNGATVLAAGQQVEITGRGLEGIRLVVQAPEHEARNLGLLSGDAVGIFAGTLRHSGQITATTAELEGGRVVLKAAGDAVVEGQGRIEATGTRGGSVDVLGQRVVLTDQAAVDASGRLGGGAIRIGGDYQGANAAVPNAERSYFGPQASLKADAAEQGDGGRIIVWADNQTLAAGSISARGGAQGGDGGFVEVSGKRALAFHAAVDLSAPLGHRGTLLLDPQYITLDSSGITLTQALLDFLDNLLGTDVTIDPASLNGIAGDIVLQAVQDINVDTPVTLAAAGKALTLQAGGFINVNAAITTTGPITLYAGDPNSGGPNEGALSVSAPITSNGGNIVLRSDLSDVGGNSVYLNANVNAGAAALALQGQRIDQVGGTLIAGAATATALANGDIVLTQAGNDFVSFSATGRAISVRDASALTLGSINAGTNLSVQTGGNLTQSAAALVSGTTTLNAGAGNVTLTTAGNNLNVLHVSGNALDIVEGAGSALTVASLSSGTNQPVTLSAGHNLTLQVPVNTGSAPLNLSGLAISLAPGATLQGGNVGLTATNAITLAAAVNASGSFTATTSTGNLVVTSLVQSGGLMNLDVGGTLQVTASSAPAALISGGSQSVDAQAIQVTGGTGSGNSARILSNSTTMQSITADSITLTGGASGSNNFALIGTQGDQSLSAITYTLTGGAGTIGNYAAIRQSGTAAYAQTVQVRSGGSITLQGGSSTATGLSAGQDGSYASIAANGTGAQTLQFVSGGSLVATGGTVGSGNYAEVYTEDGAQFITGNATLALTGGASGGGDLEDNTNGAWVGSDANAQTINALGITLQGGAGGTGNAAALLGETVQNITVGAGGLSITAGGGTGSEKTNLAGILQLGTGAGNGQTVTLVGNLTMQGGSSADTNVGVYTGPDAPANFGAGSSALIRSDGAAGQLIEFNTAGRMLSMTGGSAGSRNEAAIEAYGGTQTIRGSSIANAPTLQLTAGSGGVSGEGNLARILSVANLQTLDVGNTTLQGGNGGGVANAAVLAASQQQITVRGDLTLDGGGAVSTDGGSRIGGRTTGTNLLLQVTGDLHLMGGANGVSLGNGPSVSGQPNNITVAAGGDITLTPSATQGVRIGSRSGDVQNGAINLSAGGDITMAAGSPGARATIRTLGSVSLSASAGSILQDPSALIEADSLSAGAHSGIQLAGSGNDITHVYLGNSSSGAISYTGAANDTVTFTGVDQFAGGAVTLFVDDIGITGPINAPGGTVDIAPATASRNIRIEASPTAGVLSLSPGELVSVDTGALRIGRLDGTGSLTLATVVGSLSADSLYLRSGTDVASLAGSRLGSSGTELASDIHLEAHGNVQLDDTGILLADGHGLTITADKDANASGGLAITRSQLRVGTTAANTGGMQLAGQAITVTGSGNVGAALQVSGSGAQSLQAVQDIVLSNANTANGSVLVATESGAQTLTAGGLLSLQAGTGTNNTVTMRGASQTIQVNGLSLTAGTSGTGNSVELRSDGNQQLSIGSGGITLQAGGGAADSAAAIYQTGTAGTTQSIAVSGGGSITLQGGSASATNVGSGHGARAQIEAAGDAQSITMSGGAITLTGGTVGSRNSARIIADNGSQLVSGAGNITLTGGATGGVDNEGNVASMFATLGTQSITASGTVLLQGGAGGVENTAALTSEGNQTISAAGGLRLVGGGGGGTDMGNRAQIRSNASQTITAGGTGISVEGGSGAQSDNYANINQNGASGTQTINVSAGSIVLQGGSSTGSGAGGLGHGSFAAIESHGLSQTFTLAGGTAISLTGGTGGSRNLASIWAATGNQSITGAGAITLTGGPTGGVATAGNFSDITASAGTQSISAASIMLEGGQDGTQNYAQIFSSGNQGISAGSFVLRGGDAGTENFARIRQGNTTTGLASTQTILLAGSGGIAMQGGGGTTNLAAIQAFGTQQTLGLNGGNITLAGGTGVSNDYARIQSVNGAQTLNAVGDILMTGGTGGITDSGNFASISATVGPQEVHAGSVTLHAGGAGVDNYAGFFSPTQTLDFSGNLAMLGATGTVTNSGARIGGNRDANTNLNLDVGGTLTLTASAFSGASIGGHVVTPGGQTSDLDITAGGNITLTPSTAMGVVIGAVSPNFLPGSVSITSLGGNIAINGGGGTGRAGIASLGNVALAAAGSITQSVEGRLLADQLSATAGGAISLPGAGNSVAGFSATSGGNVEFVDARSLTLGAITANGGSRAIQITTTGASSDLTVGANSGDDSWQLTAGRDLVLAGALAGNSLALAAGGNIALNASLAAQGALSLVAFAGGSITQTAGAITAPVNLYVESGGATPGDITLTSSGNDFASVSGIGGNVRIRDANALTLDSLETTALAVRAGGALQIRGLMEASATGDAVALVSESGALSVVSPSGGISTPNGRWLLHLSDAGLAHDFGTLAPEFKQYGAVQGGPILGAATDNGLLFGNTATITAILAGSLSTKVYDGNLSLTLQSPGTFAQAQGVQAGDTVVLGIVNPGTLADKNVGSGKPVTAGVQIASVTAAGGIPVFGYTFQGTGTTNGTASGNVGEVTPATITAVNGITAASRAYDTTTAATLNLGGASFTGMVPGDVLAVASASGSFADANAGSGKQVLINGIVLGGADKDNYVLASGGTSAITLADILALASSTWTGSGGDGLWSNAANWSQGAVPAGQNVLAVVVPAGSGSIVFDAAAGSTSLQSLTSARPVLLSGGTLDIASLLQAAQYSQSGGALTGAGTLQVDGSFSQSGGSIGVGAVNITQASGNLLLGQIAAGSMQLAAPAGAIAQQAGTALTAASLQATAAQGIALAATGGEVQNHIGSLSASNTGSGTIDVRNAGVLTLASLVNAGGSIHVENVGGVATAGPVQATGDVRIQALSPLTVGLGGITAGNDIVLAAGTASAPTAADNLTINGNLQAGNQVDLFAGNALVQNGAVIGANGVTALALGSFSYGPLATTNNPPVRYSVGDAEVAAPPRVAGQTAAVGVTNLLDAGNLLQDLVEGPPPTDLQKEREKNKEEIVADGEICK